MPDLSRLKLIGAAAAIPLAVSQSATNALSKRAANDRLEQEVRAWMAAYEARERLVQEWQDWEQALSDRIGPVNIGLSVAMRGRLRHAGRIVMTRAPNMSAAVSKIEMGLRIQGPYDWGEYAFALIQDGCELLRAQL